METITNPEIQNLPPITPQNNNYKILFFVSLGLLLIIGSVLATLLITQKSLLPTQTANTQETKSITSVPTETTVIPTKTAIKSSIPKDWKTYTNDTYKYSISYPNTWTLKNENKNIFLSTPEYQKAVVDNQKNGTMSGEPDGSYNISCFKDIEEYSVAATQKSTPANSLSDYFTKNISDEYFLIKKTTINNFNTYEVEMKGLGDGNKGFFIENINSYFCVISLKYKELTDIENQFVNSFKFN